MISDDECPRSDCTCSQRRDHFDFRLGPNDDGFRYTLNFQPLIPIALSPNWNLISRSIMPIMHQSDVVPGTSQTGLGDIVQSFFFSPNKTKPFIWGFGPVLLLPTATHDFLGAGKFGIGPTLVVLKQKNGWTYGALLNHIWSVAGDDARPDVNATFLQPFVSYTTTVYHRILPWTSTDECPLSVNVGVPRRSDTPKFQHEIGPAIPVCIQVIASVQVEGPNSGRRRQG